MEELRNIENYEQFKQALDTELANQAAGFVRTGYLLKKGKRHRYPCIIRIQYSS